MNKYNILVVIVTYNAIKWVEKCFFSIYNSSIPIDCYIIDNGSTDGTQDYILNNFPDIKFYQSSTNLGFGKANNIGLQYALDNNYDYVYLLNQDAWVESNTIEKLILIHKKYPQFGILSPIQLQANKTHLDSDFGYNICSWKSNSNLFEDFYFNRRKEVYPILFVMAAHWLISRKCLETVGGFSPSFPHYGEDNNYINRAKYHGFEIGIVPDVVGMHDREKRIKNSQKRIYMTHISNIIICSNIDKISPFNKFIHIIYSTLRSIIFNHSIIPIGNLFKLALFLPQIIKNKNKSKGNHAFLKASVTSQIQ